MAIDAGAKYRGFHLQLEYYLRRLSSFVSDGALPLTSIFDHGFYVQAMQMVLPKRLGLYAVGSFVFDDFGRRPWEAAGGVSYYPAATRSWRLNLHFIYVEPLPGRLDLRLLRRRSDRSHHLRGDGLLAVRTTMSGRPFRAGSGAYEAVITTTAVLLAALGAVGLAAPAPARTAASPGTFNDNHLHLTNYIQQGTDIRQMLALMGSTVGRAAIFGIPAAAGVVLPGDRQLRADLLPGYRRAALLLLVHRRLHRHGLPIADARSSRRASIR